MATVLAGRKIYIRDNEPLRMIFTNKGLDRMILRITRWAVRPKAFNFEVKYKSGSKIVIPDFV